LQYYYKTRQNMKVLSNRWRWKDEVLRTKTSISDDLSLRLNLMRFSSETSNHTPDAVLELTVIGGVDERIDRENGIMYVK